MKKLVITMIVMASVIWVGGYVFYKFYLPGMIADAIVNNYSPPYIPKRLMNKVDELRAPVNKGADEMILVMKENDVPLLEVLEMVEDTDEEEALKFLSDLNQSKPRDPNEVFDIAKRHLKADFDVEIFRAPFVKNVNMNSINRVMQYANLNQRTKDLDIETGRLIAKHILIEKYKSVTPIKKESN